LARPVTMARERLHLEPGSTLAPWLAYTDLEPCAAPAEEVAARLGVDLEQVLGCGVEPYRAADGRQLLSINLVAVALGLRKSRLEKGRQKNSTRTPEGLERRRLRERQRRRTASDHETAESGR
jgi:hypothetical protein